MRLVERRARPEQPEPGARRGRRGCPPGSPAGRTRTAARRPRSCGPRPGSARGSRAPVLDRRVREPVEVVVVEGLEDLLDPHRLGRREAAGPDRLLDLLDRRVAHLVPALEALAQARVGDVAVAVVGVLGEDGEDELVDRARGGGAGSAGRTRPGAGRGSPGAGAGRLASSFGSRAARLGCPAGGGRRSTAAEVDGRRRSAGSSAGDAPILYLHGVPDSGETWRPFLERTGGIAPDLPGFGRSAKGGDFDYSIEGYDRFLDAFVDALGLDRFSARDARLGRGRPGAGAALPGAVERLVLDLGRAVPARLPLAPRRPRLAHAAAPASC